MRRPVMTLPSFVTARTEHKSVLDPFRRLEKEGFSVSWLAPGESGRIDHQAVAAARHHFFRQRFYRRKPFPVLTAGKFQHVIADPGQSCRQRCALVLPDVGGGHHENLAGFRRHVPGGVRQQAALHQCGVTPRRGIDAKSRHR